MAETKYLAGAELLRVSRTQQYLRYPLNLALFCMIDGVSFLAKLPTINFLLNIADTF